MKISALPVLAAVASSSLFATEASDAVLAKNPIVSNTLTAYNTAANKIEQERLRAVISLNEKFLVELARAKSTALRAEKLAEANAIEAKIKELTEATVSLKGIASGKTETVSAPSASLGKTAKKLSGFVTGSNLSSEAKRNLNAFAEGKLVLFIAASGSSYLLDGEGGLTKRLKNGTLNSVDAGTTFASGKLTTKDGTVFDFTTATSEGVSAKWKENDMSLVFVTADEIEARASAVSAKSAPHKVTPADSDPDNTIFGRRQK